MASRCSGFIKGDIICWELKGNSGDHSPQTSISSDRLHRRTGAGSEAVGYKCITYDGALQFRGHFPQEPVMPGVLMIEALAQVGAVAILSVEENKGQDRLFWSH